MNRGALRDSDDLFVLGIAAAAAARRATEGRGIFACWRRLLPTGVWQGPKHAACAFVEERDLEALGGIGAVRTAGANTLMATSPTLAVEASLGGLRGLLRLLLPADEPAEAQAERLTSLHDQVRAGLTLDGVVPTPTEHSLGIATLLFVARCRVTLVGVPHVLVDLECLGPKFGQLCLGFGADELAGPILTERPLRLGDNAGSPAITRQEAAQLLRGAGLRAFERVAGGTLEEFEG